MAETDVDPAVETDASETAPADDGFSFGTDMAGPDESESAVPAEEGATSTAPDPSNFDPASIEDWRRVDPNEVPEQYRHLAKMASQLEAGHRKRDEDLREQQKRTEQRENQLLGILSTQAEGNKPPAEDPYAGLTEAHRGAVDAVREVLNIEVGNRLEQAEQRNSQLEQAILKIAQHQMSQRAAGINNEAVAVRQEFGDDIDRFSDAIRQDIATVNPLTGKNYTIRDSYLMRSNKIADETIKARQQDLEARQNASADTNLSGAVDTSEETPISDNELLSLVGKLPGLRLPG